MEKLFSEILGTPVVAEHGAEPVGRILNVLIHPENGQVVAFSLDFSFKRMIVPMDIHGWFREVVISSENDVVGEDDIVRVRQVLEQNILIFKNRVETRSGKYLGRVFDFAVDVDHMMLTKIFVAKSVLGLVQYDQRVFSFHQILEIRQNKIVVKRDMAEEKAIKGETELATG